MLGGVGPGGSGWGGEAWAPPAPQGGILEGRSPPSKHPRRVYMLLKLHIRHQTEEITFWPPKNMYPLRVMRSQFAKHHSQQSPTFDYDSKRL